MSAPNLLVGLLAAAIAVLGGVWASAAIEDAVPEDRWLPGITVPGVTTPRVPVPGATTPGAPAPEERGSTRRLAAPLYRAASFREVLRRLRAARLRRVSSLRVDADDVVALGEARGRRIVAILRADGTQRTVATPTGARLPGFPLSRLRAGVPGSLVRRVARRAGVSPALVDYLVATASPIDARGYWVVFLRDGRGFYRAQLDGTGLRRGG